MARRQLTNKELVYVVQDYHVNSDGSLATRVRLHVGRIGVSSRSVIALACGRGPEPRFVYPYLTMLPWASAFVCQGCIVALRAEIEGRGVAFVERGGAPSSNTGVNS